MNKSVVLPLLLIVLLAVLSRATLVPLQDNFVSESQQGDVEDLQLDATVQEEERNPSVEPEELLDVAPQLTEEETAPDASASTLLCPKKTVSDVMKAIGEYPESSLEFSEASKYLGANGLRMAADAGKGAIIALDAVPQISSVIDGVMDPSTKEQILSKIASRVGLAPFGRAPSVTVSADSITPVDRTAAVLAMNIYNDENGHSGSHLKVLNQDGDFIVRSEIGSGKARAQIVDGPDATRYIVLRGSFSPQDVVTDPRGSSSQIFAENGKPLGSAHTGAVNRYNSIRQELLQAATSDLNPGQQVVFTGHSLGATLAHIAAADFLSDPHAASAKQHVRLTTFGSPAFTDALLNSDLEMLHVTPARYVATTQRHGGDLSFDDIVSNLAILELQDGVGAGQHFGEPLLLDVGNIPSNVNELVHAVDSHINGYLKAMFALELPSLVQETVRGSAPAPTINIDELGDDTGALTVNDIQSGLRIAPDLCQSLLEFGKQLTARLEISLVKLYHDSSNTVWLNNARHLSGVAGKAASNFNRIGCSNLELQRYDNAGRQAETILTKFGELPEPVGRAWNQKEISVLQRTPHFQKMLETVQRVSYKLDQANQLAEKNVDSSSQLVATQFEKSPAIRSAQSIFESGNTAASKFSQSRQVITDVDDTIYTQHSVSAGAASLLRFRGDSIRNKLRSYVRAVGAEAMLEMDLQESEDLHTADDAELLLDVDRDTLDQMQEQCSAITAQAERIESSELQISAAANAVAAGDAFVDDILCNKKHADEIQHDFKKDVTPAMQQLIHAVDKRASVLMGRRPTEYIQEDIDESYWGQAQVEAMQRRAREYAGSALNRAANTVGEYGQSVVNTVQDKVGEYGRSVLDRVQQRAGQYGGETLQNMVNHYGNAAIDRVQNTVGEVGNAAVDRLQQRVGDLGNAISQPPPQAQAPPTEQVDPAAASRALARGFQGAGAATIEGGAVAGAQGQGIAGVANAGASLANGISTDGSRTNAKDIASSQQTRGDVRQAEKTVADESRGAAGSAQREVQKSDGSLGKSVRKEGQEQRDTSRNAAKSAEKSVSSGDASVEAAVKRSAGRVEEGAKSAEAVERRGAARLEGQVGGELKSQESARLDRSIRREADKEKSAEGKLAEKLENVEGRKNFAKLGDKIEANADSVKSKMNDDSKDRLMKRQEKELGDLDRRLFKKDAERQKEAGLEKSMKRAEGEEKFRDKKFDQLSKEQRKDEDKRREDGALKRFEDRVKKTANNEADVKKEIDGVGKSFGEMAKKIEKGDEKLEKSVEKGIQKGAEGNTAQKNADKLKGEIRANADATAEKKALSGIEKAVEKGTDELKDESRKAEKKSEKAANSEAEKNAFKDAVGGIKKNIAKDAKKGLDAARDTSKDVGKDLKKEAQQKKMQSKIDGIKKSVARGAKQQRQADRAINKDISANQRAAQSSVDATGQSMVDRVEQQGEDQARSEDKAKAQVQRADDREQQQQSNSNENLQNAARAIADNAQREKIADASKEGAENEKDAEARLSRTQGREKQEMRQEKQQTQGRADRIRDEVKQVEVEAKRSSSVPKPPAKPGQAGRR